MKRLLSLLLMLFPVCAWSQATIGFHRTSIAQVKAYGSTYVQVMPYATVTVDATATGSAATIYSDPLLTAPIPNAIVTADDNGNYDYYIPLGYCVTENVSSPGQGSYTTTNICVGVSGSVESGTAGQLGYYAATGNQLSGLNVGTGLSISGGTLNSAPGSGVSGLVQISNGSGLLTSDSNVSVNTTTHTLTATVLNAVTQFSVNGTQISASDLSNGTTGTGSVALATSPSLTTPNIGAATGTSLSTSGSISSSTGFQIGGTAPSNHILVGNGTVYADASSVPASAVSGLFYQTIDANGIAQTQRPVQNYSSYFSITDSASPAETNIGLQTAGTDSKLVTTSGPSTLNYYGCGDANGGLTWSVTACGTSAVDETWVAQTLCTPATSTDASCTGSFTYPSGFAFADTGYGLWIQGASTSGAFIFAVVTAKTTTTFSYIVTCTFNCSAYGTVTFDIRGTHP